MSNLNYSFVKTDDGVLTFRSTVNSFGLESTVDKNITSFYNNFSDQAYLDTGLLPVDGTGMLCYRKAANHAQIVYQIKPGIYYINWGRHENDPEAKAYYVAQPYRIVIADLLNNNLLGARTFYSPYPITHPDSQLYHVNLPNINCRGYRGNGVGWICLYHTHDISEYPFNEKVAHILERCSGIESYNDANMSETDGPRFYSSYYENNPSYSFLWDPSDWQNKTSQEQYEWTLDPDLWIPVLVTDMDIQGAHDPSGEPLTIYKALFGNYQAYYTDTLIPKPINALVRQDLQLSSSTILNTFVVSYNNSLSTDEYRSPNTFDLSAQKRESDILKVHTPQMIHLSDSPNCENCGIELDEEFYCEDISNPLCANCFANECCYVEHLDKYFLSDNQDIRYDEYHDQYFHIKYLNSDQHVTCTSCSSFYYISSNSYYNKYNIGVYYPSPSFQNSNPLPLRCLNCAKSSHHCYSCYTSLPDPSEYTIPYIIAPDGNRELLCHHCYVRAPHFVRSLSTLSDLDITSNGVENIATCMCGKEHPFYKFKLLHFDLVASEIDQNGNLPHIAIKFTTRHRVISYHHGLSINLSFVHQDQKELYTSFVSDTLKNISQNLYILGPNNPQDTDIDLNIFNHIESTELTMYYACSDCYDNIYNKLLVKSENNTNFTSLHTFFAFEDVIHYLFESYQNLYTQKPLYLDFMKGTATFSFACPRLL